MEKLKVIELFAGVGGFRLGLEDTGFYEVVWGNQWEPSTKRQHASEVYSARFGEKGHSNEDIATVDTAEIPDADMLVGGFPCQDYSVASTLKSAKGLIGKKGVLWWSIHRILSEKRNRPGFLMLENVDRLLKSPAGQRGRDFAIILKSLGDLGYAVEWRVINAADYGMPQRRRRVFLMAYHKSTSIYRRLQVADSSDWMLNSGIMVSAFPVTDASPPKEVFSKSCPSSFSLDNDLVAISDGFNTGGKLSPFRNTGIYLGDNIYTLKTTPDYSGRRMVLGDVLQHDKVDEHYFIPQEDLPKWDYLKGAKKELRKAKNGFDYQYAEGSMVFPDALDNASRTIVTGEGGRGPSRFKHVVATAEGLRRLTPLELERLNMFPDGHTALSGISDSKRAFFMGNALVVGVVKKLGASLYEHVQEP